MYLLRGEVENTNVYSRLWFEAIGERIPDLLDSTQASALVITQKW